MGIVSDGVFGLDKIESVQKKNENTMVDSIFESGDLLSLADVRAEGNIDKGEEGGYGKRGADAILVEEGGEAKKTLEFGGVQKSSNALREKSAPLSEHIALIQTIPISRKGP